MEPIIRVCGPMSVARLGIAFLAIQGVFLLSAAPCCSQDERQENARQLILTAETSIMQRQREEAHRRLAEMPPEQVAQACREMLTAPDELPDYAPLLVAMLAVIRVLGPEEGAPIIREALLLLDDERVASDGLEIPLWDTSWGWELYEDVATNARSKAVRKQARANLQDLASGSDEFGQFQPSKALGSYYRGLAHLHGPLGRRDARDAALRQARADFEQAIALDPTLVEAYVERGNVLIESGHYEAAIDSLNTAIALDPRHGRVESYDIGQRAGGAYTLRSKAHTALGHEAEAEADRQAAERVRREVREAHLRSPEGLLEEAQAAKRWILHGPLARGSSETAPRDFPKALPHLDNVVRYHPEQASYRLLRGMLHHQLGRAADALVDYDAYLGAGHDAPYVHCLRAQALTRLGREEQAATAEASYEEGIAAFEAPTLPTELPRPEHATTGLDYFQVVELAKAPRENAETLARVVLGAGTDGPTWSKAIWALEELDDGQLIPLVPYLEQATLVCEMHYPGRLTLVSLLGRAGQASSIPYLLHAATDARPEAFAWRKKAVEALGELPREVAEPALQRLVLASEDRKVVDWSVRQLLELSGESYRHFCVRTMLCAPRKYQIRAAKALDDTLSLLVLLEIIRDEKTERAVRQEAAAVLRRGWPTIAESAHVDLADG